MKKYRFSTIDTRITAEHPLLKTSLFLIVLFYSSFVQAVPPISFDRWSASANGTISASCPAGYTCNENVTSENMLQRILINNSSGQTYIQVLLADGVVRDTGRLIYESFVNANEGTASGISSKLQINQTGVEDLDYSVILNLGWANANGAPAIDFSQTVKDTYNSGVTLDYTFDYQQNQNANGTATGYKYGIRQNLRNTAALNGSGNGDVWTFVLRRAGGNFVNAGSASLPSSAAGGMGGGGGGGGGGMGAALSTGGVTAGTASTAGSNQMGRALNNGTVSGTAFTMPDEGYGLNTPNIGFPEDTIIGPGTSNDPPIVGNLPGSRFNVSDNQTLNESHINVSTRSGIGGGIVSNGNARGPDIPAGRIDVPTGSTGGMGGGMGGGGGGGTGGTVAWNTGNEVQVIWIGQNCPSCVLSGGMGGMGGGNGAFSYESYENLNTGATSISRSITSTAPLSWSTAPFGAQPRL